MAKNQKSTTAPAAIRRPAAVKDPRVDDRRCFGHEAPPERMRLMVRGGTLERHATSGQLAPVGGEVARARPQGAYLPMGGDVMDRVGHGVGLAARPGAVEDDRHVRSVGVWRCPGLFGGAHEGSAFRWIRLVVWLGGVSESRRSRLRAAS